MSESDEVKQPCDDPGRSLLQEVAALRGQVAQLAEAVRGLTKLQAISNQKLDAAITGKPTFDVL